MAFDFLRRARPFRTGRQLPASGGRCPLSQHVPAVGVIAADLFDVGVDSGYRVDHVDNYPAHRAPGKLTAVGALVPSRITENQRFLLLESVTVEVAYTTDTRSEAS